MTKLQMNMSLLMLAFAFISCSNDDSIAPSLCDQQVIISADQYANAVSDNITINSVELTGDCLAINYGASGCSGESWVLELIDSGDVTSSLPRQRNLRLVIDNGEACQAVFTQEITFDVSALKVDGNQVLLNIVNSDHQVDYQY